MECKELLKILNEYVDGDIDAGVCEQFEKHMADCNPCQIVVDNIRRTIQIYKNDEPFELPPEFTQRLHQTLREQWLSLIHI